MFLLAEIMIHNLNAIEVNFVMDKTNDSFSYLIKVTGITSRAFHSLTLKYEEWRLRRNLQMFLHG